MDRKSRRRLNAKLFRWTPKEEAMNKRSGMTIWVPYLEAQLEVLIRSAVRGRNTLALTKKNSRTIDSFQHIEDEATRTLLQLRRLSGKKPLEKETQGGNAKIRL